MNSSEMLERYQGSMLGVFGSPQLVIAHGEGCYLVDVDGRRYLDLLGGIAVNALGYNHPAMTSALAKQAQAAVHVSNFFTTPAQIELGERLLSVAKAPEGSRVFFCNSGTEANEAAIKLARKTGRPTIIVADGAFHGRTMGALSLTAKAAYREPFEPLLPGIIRVAYNDVDVLKSVIKEDVAAVILEPIQGEAGVIEAAPGYLEAVRDLTSEHGALMILDEVQTGVGRTGEWFAHHASDVSPDAITVAKGLGGGVPIGALITYGEKVSGMLTAGQHGTTFGGNPLACAAALAVLETIEDDELLDNAQTVGNYFAQRIDAMNDPRVVGQRGRGFLRAIILRDEIAADVVTAAREAGFIVNAPGANTLRLAPPLTITTQEIDTFIDALPAILDRIEAK